MITKLSNSELLTKILEIALNYGVSGVQQHPDSNRILISYQVLGQGSALADLIDGMFKSEAPDREYNIKMTPSDRTLLVELLG